MIIIKGYIAIVNNVASLLFHFLFIIITWLIMYAEKDADEALCNVKRDVVKDVFES